MAKRILVAVDGSTEAQDALAFAASEWPDAELTALHVINPADSATGADGGFPVPPTSGTTAPNSAASGS